MPLKSPNELVQDVDLQVFADQSCAPICVKALPAKESLSALPIGFQSRRLGWLRPSRAFLAEDEDTMIIATPYENIVSTAEKRFVKALKQQVLYALEGPERKPVSDGGG